jgi:hypothetical protein
MITKFLTFNYFKTLGVNVLGWWNVTFQANVAVSGESFRVWASFAIVATVGILTACKIIKDIRRK